ncbi:MAG TPA: tetratricopeptide repeat protein [Pyrinomonadaceae bacterium]|nr:tetratricopeptide repeat protein [Pyrinomonadaceae bacterium]
MNWKVKRTRSAALMAMSVLIVGVSAVRAQHSVGAANRPAISVLDSTKEQDGLVGSVRRVKTETAKIDFKDGRAVEGPAQLVEVTTYGIKGNRVENTSYPIGSSLVGKEEYKYDERGNITEMTLRDDRGAILSREAYSYEFDKFGNWTKMVTSLVVFENGELKREPTEVTYRTVTYYFDDTVAKVIEAPVPAPVLAPSVPETATQIQEIGFLEIVFNEAPRSIDVGEPPPALLEKIDGVESAFTARKENEIVLVAAGSDRNLANHFYLNGRSQFDAGDVHGAIDSFLQSIKLESASAEVFLNLGHAYLTIKKDGEAVKAFHESLKLNPDNAETQYGLGFANFRLRRFKDAADAFKKATTLNPQMAKAHYGLSLAYQEMGNTSGLLQEHRILERLDRSLAHKLEQTFPQYNFSCRLAVGCP